MKLRDWSTAKEQEWLRESRKVYCVAFFVIAIFILGLAGVLMLIDKELPEDAWFNLAVILLGVYGIVTVFCFFSYWEHNAGTYFFADFPFDTKLGLTTFIWMLPFFVVFIISRRNMQYWLQTTGLYLPEEEASAEPEGPITPETHPGHFTYLEPVQISDECPKLLREFITAVVETQNRKPLEEIEREIESLESFIDARGQRAEMFALEIADAKEKLERKQAQLATMEAEIPPVDVEGKTQEFWCQLRTLRGLRHVECLNVSEMDESELSTRYTMDVADAYGEFELDLVLSATTEYDGTCYDLGDYLVRVSEVGDCSCSLQRSGLIEGVDEGALLYGDEVEFCFGSVRSYSIKDYLREGRIMEALFLIVNSLNHVNDGDLEELPMSYRALLTAPIS